MHRKKNFIDLSSTSSGWSPTGVKMDSSEKARNPTAMPVAMMVIDQDNIVGLLVAMAVKSFVFETSKIWDMRFNWYLLGKMKFYL